jgi:hypothetical protein
MKPWEQMTDDEREPYFDAAVDILSDHLTCTRDWKAWDYGAMSADDFHPAGSDQTILYDTAYMLYKFKARRL